jgi:uncharacterized protein (TIGR01777 family)
MIGKVLTKALLQKGYHVIILSREPAKHPQGNNLSYAAWDIGQQTIDTNAITKADHIIHLAGAGVADKRWTKKRKQEIIDSRVKSGALLVKALQENTNRVKTVVSASAIGWYGPDPVVPNPVPFTETAPADPGFLGQTCFEWEQSLQPITGMGKRLVQLRIGIVLSAEGGALAEFKKPLRMGVATILGNGKQVISWIHIDDLVKMYIKAIEDDSMQGPYNAVAPLPVVNKELILCLARNKKRFYIPVHVPAFVLKIVLGEMSIEVLKSATVSAAKIKTTGFDFSFPSIADAIRDLG